MFGITAQMPQWITTTGQVIFLDLTKDRFTWQNMYITMSLPLKWLKLCFLVLAKALSVDLWTIRIYDILLKTVTLSLYSNADLVSNTAPTWPSSPRTLQWRSTAKRQRDHWRTLGPRRHSEVTTKTRDIRLVEHRSSRSRIICTLARACVYVCVRACVCVRVCAYVRVCMCV